MSKKEFDEIKRLLLVERAKLVERRKSIHEDNLGARDQNDLNIALIDSSTDSLWKLYSEQ